MPLQEGEDGRGFRPILEQTRAFWGDALDLEPIRIVDDRFARLTGRAFVVHDTIHWLEPAPRAADPDTMSTVIHELAHCWQHQTGRWQLTRGLIEQTLYTLFGWWLVGLGRKALYDPYDYGGPVGLTRAGTRTPIGTGPSGSPCAHSRIISQTRN